MGRRLVKHELVNGGHLCSSEQHSLCGSRLMHHDEETVVIDLALAHAKTTGRGEVDWRELYLDVARASALGAVRFRGVFTDGGCDEGLMQYWVDNLFCANHHESHCSAARANIHAIGLLLVCVRFDPTVRTISTQPQAQCRQLHEGVNIRAIRLLLAPFAVIALCGSSCLSVCCWHAGIDRHIVCSTALIDSRWCIVRHSGYSSAMRRADAFPSTRQRTRTGRS